MFMMETTMTSDTVFTNYKLMALLKFIIITTFATGSATAMAFSLGASKLPIVSRNAGRTIGMWFNYFKVMLKLMTPKAEEANVILS